MKEMEAVLSGKCAVEDLRKVMEESFSCVAVLDDVQSRTIRSCEFSKCGRYLATASFDSTTVVWEKGKNEEQHITWNAIATLEGHENEVKCVSWSPDGKYLATCSRDKSVWIWSVPDDERMAASEEEEDWDAISVLNGHTQDVKFVAWNPSQSVLYSASYDDTIKAWAEDVEDWGCFETLTGHTNTVWSLAFNADGNLLASVSQDKTVRIWKNTAVDTGYRWELVQSLEGAHDRTIFSVHWVGDLLVTGGADDLICVYRYKDKLELIHQEKQAHLTDVNCVRWNGKIPGLCASASDDATIKLWLAQS